MAYGIAPAQALTPSGPRALAEMGFILPRPSNQARVIHIARHLVKMRRPVGKELQYPKIQDSSLLGFRMGKGWQDLG